MLQNKKKLSKGIFQILAWNTIKMLSSAAFCGHRARKHVFFSELFVLFVHFGLVLSILD